MCYAFFFFFIKSMLEALGRIPLRAGGSALGFFRADIALPLSPQAGEVSCRGGGAAWKWWEGNGGGTQ